MTKTEGPEKAEDRPSSAQKMKTVVCRMTSCADAVMPSETKTER